MPLSLHTSTESSKCKPLCVHTVFVYVSVCGRVFACMNMDSSESAPYRGHTAILLASGDAVMVCGTAEALHLVSGVL